MSRFLRLKDCFIPVSNITKINYVVYGNKRGWEVNYTTYSMNLNGSLSGSFNEKYLIEIPKSQLNKYICKNLFFIEGINPE